MSRYITTKGDTFDNIARIAYGDGAKAYKIREANPQLSEPIRAGVAISIPSDDSLPPIAPPQVDAPVDGVSVLINGEIYDDWTRVGVDLVLDGIDTFSVEAPMRVDDRRFRDAFRPLSFNPVSIGIGGEGTILNGVMLPVEPNVSAQQATVTASGYSRPGVLNDCTAPVSTYPLEFENATLQTIARRLCRPFGITPVFLSGAGAAFESVGVTASQGILNILIKLAKQRCLIVGNDEQGQLTFFTTRQQTPVGNLVEGAQPLLSVRPRISAQGYYSHISGLAPSSVFEETSASTVRNPNTDVFRPKVFTEGENDFGNIGHATTARMSRMFADAIQYDVQVMGWFNPAGSLWKPGQSVRLLAPEAMVYFETEFLIKKVSLSQSKADGSLATLTLILPESFAARIPQRLPWDEQ